MNYQNISCINNELYINGNKIPNPPRKRLYNNIVQINNRLFINGYEWKNGRWKMTVCSFLSIWF